MKVVVDYDRCRSTWGRGEGAGTPTQAITPGG